MNHYLIKILLIALIIVLPVKTMEQAPPPMTFGPPPSLTDRILESLVQGDFNKVKNNIDMILKGKVPPQFAESIELIPTFAIKLITHHSPALKTIEILELLKYLLLRLPFNSPNELIVRCIHQGFINWLNFPDLSLTPNIGVFFSIAIQTGNIPAVKLLCRYFSHALALLYIDPVGGIQVLQFAQQVGNQEIIDIIQEYVEENPTDPILAATT